MSRIGLPGILGLLVLGGCGDGMADILDPVPAYCTHQVTVERSVDRVEALLGDSITVTVSVSNAEAGDVRGFYYADHIPHGLTVETVGVTADGSPVSGYAYEAGAAGEVYAGCVTHRWILETPPGFVEENPVEGGGSVEIVYQLRSAGSGVFDLNEFNWAGYDPGTPEAVFGHSGAWDRRTVEFAAWFAPKAPAVLPGILHLLLSEPGG